jgi:hypothetical protein
MIAPITGILLGAEDVRYTLRAFDALLRGRRPSAELAAFIDRLGRTVATTGVSSRDTGTQARQVGSGDNSGQPAMYDVLDTAEAAAILGITTNGVRDLARRGVLPAKRAGGRWLYGAHAVVSRAERRAANR